MNKIQPYPNIALPSEAGLLFVRSNDILYCQAEGSYTHLYLSTGESVKVCRKLKTVQTTLSTEIFVRIHHSYVVNLSHVISFNNLDQINLSNGMQLGVSRSRRNELLERFTKI